MSLRTINGVRSVFSLVILLCLPMLMLRPSLCQETRGQIAGRVLDASSAVVAGASVTVTNKDTNTSLQLTTNDTGYFEANLLMPGNYDVAVEATGFKRSLRSGLELSVGARLDVVVRLEIGVVSDAISVTAESPMLDTSSVSSGRTLNNRTLMELPFVANSVINLAKTTVGLQTSGVNPASAILGSVSAASDYYLPGKEGGSEWSIDGAPNNGAGRYVAYLPYTDSVQEFRVETSSFDASQGHSLGTNVVMMTKSGTNALHGTLTEQHFQQRWQGSGFFVKQNYYKKIAEAEAAGNTATANYLRSQDKQPSGRSHNFAATVSGPVVLPRIYNGKDKLFFFLSYAGLKENKTEVPDSLNRTVPTLANREGDFSDLLAVNSKYQIYDPLTVRADSSRATHYVRDPIPGNILPKSRIVNPAYKKYLSFLPTPNNSPADPRSEPTNNYLAIGSPYIWDLYTVSNRIDYNRSERNRFFGRWHRSKFTEDRSDWTYETARGLQSNALNRRNIGVTVDWVRTISGSTVLDLMVAGSEFKSGNLYSVPLSYKPSDVGLPTYIDTQAGSRTILPTMSWSGYSGIGTSYPTLTAARTYTAKSDLSQVRGSHSLRAGIDFRSQQRSAAGSSTTGGSFSFTSAYTQKNDDSYTPAGSLGLSWAAFMMGLPATATITTVDDYITGNPYVGWFAQDNWRLTPKLTLTLGLRFEYEIGPLERYNRMVGYFDTMASLPISSAAQAAYAAAPVSELAASAFQVRGGTVYPGLGGAGRRIFDPELMLLPRLALAYQADSRTVLRGGYGVFYDSINVLDNSPDQTGFSRTTTTTISNDYGVTWKAGNPQNGVSPMSDPFPVRADGTRFDAPVRNALGLMAKAGTSYSYIPKDVKHARLQRWRMGLQRQIGSNLVVEVAYSGQYGDRLAASQSLDVLPGQFWATGTTRNAALASNLTSNVTNPFYIGNFSGLQTSDAVVYQALASSSYFTSKTIQKQYLLRAYPSMTSLTNAYSSLGKMRSHSVEASVERRFAKGFTLNFGYTALRLREADYFYNEWDTETSWRLSTGGRPHRIVGSGIYELPFGQGRAMLTRGLPSLIAGGWQIGITYEYQPGAYLSFSNLFYYGDLDDIRVDNPTLGRWFNTDNFEKNASKAPASYHSRVFPTYVSGVTADMTNQWNANVVRQFRLTERVRLQLRLDALNLQNRSQFAAPTTDPLSTNFGKVTSQSSTHNRFIQIQGRIQF